MNESCEASQEVKDYEEAFTIMFEAFSSSQVKAILNLIKTYDALRPEEKEKIWHPEKSK